MLDPDLMVSVQDARGLRPARNGEVSYLYRVIEIEEIYLDTSEPEHEAVVLLRDLGRPGCLFWWRAPAVESGDLEDELGRAAFRDIKDAAESHAIVIPVNLDEDVLAIGHGLPKGCSPGAITWF